MTDFAPALFAGRTGRERNPIRIVLWMLLTAFFTLLGSLPVALGVALLAPDMLPALSEGTALPDTPGRLRQETAFMLLVSLTLAAAAAGAVFAARIVFGRSPSSLLTPAAPFRWSLLLLGALIFAVLVAIAVAMDPLIGGEALDPPILDATYPAADRLLYALAAVFVLLLAAAAEEVIFRGVLLQITGAFTRNVLVLALINGVLFSAIHWDFDPTSFLARTALGAAFTWTVLKLGGLEFAIGAHAANNIVLCWLGDPLSEAADITKDPPPVYAVIDAVLCVAMIAAVLAISRTAMVRRWIGRPAGSGF